MNSYQQKDPKAKLLKSYLPPFKGTWKTLPAYLIPDDAIQDSLNVTILGGKLRSRCGLLSYNANDLGNKVLGSFLNVDTLNIKSPICSTRNKILRFIHNGWQDITGAVTLTATDEAQIRMSSLQLGTNVYVLYTNQTDTLKIISQAGYLAADITPRTGTIPILWDVCTSFSRFVGIQPPYAVRWCDIINDQYLSFTSWPALNQAILADTEDSLVAIRSLGTLGVAVYKEGNIFVGIAQTGNNSQAFRFEHRGEYEGPAGVNAIVNVNGSHVYMTPSGRIGLFNGTQQNWIADGIWPFLQDDLDPLHTGKIFGVYNYLTAEITFWYPRQGDNGECKGMIIVDIPYPLAGIQDFAYFIGRSAFPCSNGLTVRIFDSRKSPLIFGGENETFVLDKDTYSDRYLKFPCGFTQGLFQPTETPTPGERINDNHNIYLPILSVLASRGSGRGLVGVSAMTSGQLEDDGVASQKTVIDLTDTPFNEYLAFPDAEGSFLGVQFTWDSTAKFEYKGCDIYGRAVL